MATSRRVDNRAMALPTSRHVSVAFVVVAATLVTGNLLTAGLTGDLVTEVAVVLSVVSVGLLLRRGHLTSARPWIWLFVGMAALWLYSVVWIVDVHVLHQTSDAPGIVLMPVLAYAAFMVGGFRLLLVPDRHAVTLMLDSGMFAVTVSLSVWVFVLGPYFDHIDHSHAQRTVALVALALTSIITGTLVAVAVSATKRSAALGYLLLAALATGVGVVGRALTTSAGEPDGSPWITTMWIVGFCATAAAAVDPSAADLTRLPVLRSTRITPTTLVGLGSALSCWPVVAIVQDLTGTHVDGLAIGIGMLTLIPLVLMRIGFLSQARADAERQLDRLARFDELTGLANRRELDAQVSAALDRLARGEVPGVVAVFCDLDGFKEVNDARGHRTGDQVLAVVARRLRAALRARDVVARFGGDEFVVIAEGDPEAVRRETVRRIEDALLEPVRLGTLLTPVQASVGAAVALPGQSISADQLLSAADAAMYRQKRLRRGAEPAKPGAPRH